MRDRPATSEPDMAGAFVPLAPATPMADPPARVICFYLPQFHPIPENDAWWGKDFTEWVNVRGAVPQFPGHRQPRVPGELGYYDLRDPGVRRRQVELAQMHGIGGFCFYFYWFDGKRLLEQPIRDYADDPEARLPFCLCWANENWTRRWDGLEGEVLIGQKHSAADDLAFIEHVASYMRNPRYIRIDGRPLLVVYRPNLLPSALETTGRWREWCRENGLGEIALACTQSFEAADPARYGLDFAIEFPPNNTAPPDITAQATGPDAAFRGHVFDWAALAERSGDYPQATYPLFRAVSPGWDNTPRRGDAAFVFVNNTPARFQAWLENAIRDTRLRFARPDERLVFVNAWNEWGEGAYLEPDTGYGYAWLAAVRNALESQRDEAREAAMALLADTVHAHEARLPALQDALSKSTAATAYLEAEVAAMHQALARLASQLVVAADARLRLEERIATLEETLVEHARSAASLARAMTVKESEVSDLRAQGDLHIASARQAREESGQLRTMLIAAEVRERQREEMISLQHARIAALEQAAEEAVRAAAAEKSPPARPAGRLREQAMTTLAAVSLARPPGWRTLRPVLRPVSQIADAGNGEYASTGGDPQFLLDLGGARAPSGWCRLRYRYGNSSGGALQASLYVDDGAGFREELRHDLVAAGASGVAEKWVRLPRGTVALRFDPADRACNFSIDGFELFQAGRLTRAAALVLPYAKVAIANPRRGARLAMRAQRLLRDGGLRALKDHILKRATGPGEYAEWVARFDTFSPADLARMGRESAQWPQPPLISVLMPVYNPPLRYLKEAIESVRRQNYPHWELCIADDASTAPGVREEISLAAAADHRIKTVFRDSNGHISAAANSALAIASGAFVALLDHDDVLPDHALHFVAAALVANPRTGVLYSDEDKIDDQGRRHDPYFKCGWNRYLLRSQNMFCHLTVLNTALAREAGGFRAGYEGAQDHDLVLRCVERLQSADIVHVPRILYHWRAIPGSTAQAGSEKPYAAIAGQRAVQDHLDRSGVTAHVDLMPIGHFRVRYALPDPAPLVSLIIPTRNGVKLLRQCIESVRARTTYRHYELIVVDNNSDEPATLEYLEVLRGSPDARVIADPRPFNFSALNNLAVQQARGELVCLLNNDIEVISPDWLGEMVSLALQPGAGAVGARLLYPDGRLQHGGVILGIGGVAGHSHKHLPRENYGYSSRAVLTQSMSAVTAACLVVRKSLYLEAGGLDEVNLAVAFNDVDFCMRLRAAGYENIWTPFAELYHHESASRGAEDNPEKKRRFQKEAEFMFERWGEALRDDPAYSPNLTLAREDFSLAWPPRIAGAA